MWKCVGNGQLRALADGLHKPVDDIDKGFSKTRFEIVSLHPMPGSGSGIFISAQQSCVYRKPYPS
jgi:hypothetical protein